MGWNKLASGKDYGGINYDKMCSVFSQITDQSFKWERKDDQITLYTDGDPQETLETLVLTGIVCDILSGVASYDQYGGDSRERHTHEN